MGMWLISGAIDHTSKPTLKKPLNGLGNIMQMMRYFPPAEGLLSLLPLP